MKNKNPKYAFYYALSLLSLMFVSIFSAVIVFQIIDKSIFDSFSSKNFFINQGLLRFSISALLISGPLFFFCASMINRGLKKGELDKDSPLRTWLSYFILAVATVVILGSIIGILNNFLSGEITLKSVLKLLTVIIISALVFSFYLYDMKRKNVSNDDKVIKSFFFISLILVLIIFISSWFFLESPRTARAKKADSFLLNKISTLEYHLNDYYEKKGELPDNLIILEEFVSTYSFREVLSEILSENNIEYKKIDDENFEICATFLTDNNDYGQNFNFPVYYDDYAKIHVPGYNCFPGHLWIKDRKIQN